MQESGAYRKNSFRTTDQYFLRKYFREEDSLFRISDTVKEYVNFNHLHLLDPFKIKLVGTVDIIFCRNVLIDFDHESRKKVVDMFRRRLVDGGD